MKTFIIIGLIVSQICSAQIIKSGGKYLADKGEYVYTTNYVDPHSVDVYVILGQSNTGVPTVATMPVDSQAKYSGIISNAYIFNPVYQSKWQALNVGVNSLIYCYDSSKCIPTGFGVEAAIAYNLGKAKPVYFYKYGFGGTSMHQDWYKGNWLYRRAILNGLLPALDSLVAQNKIPVIKDVIWIQGESDAIEGFQSFYETELNQFFIDLKTDIDNKLLSLNLPQSNYTKTIVVLNSNFGAGTVSARSTVIDAQLNYIRNYQNKTKLLYGDDLPRLDNLHYNAYSQLRLGWRYLKI